MRRSPNAAKAVWATIKNDGGANYLRDPAFIQTVAARNLPQCGREHAPGASSICGANRLLNPWGSAPKKR